MNSPTENDAILATFPNKISYDGVAYYHSLIDELLKNDIEPLLTLYHWDHPQILEDAGGWLNAEMVDWFGDFARIVYKEYAPKVKLFIPINEPTVMCKEGYTQGKHAPGKYLHGFGEYLCIHNILKAHARAYRIYEQEFNQTYPAQVGFLVNLPGYLTQEVVGPSTQFIRRGTADFLALNHYTSRLVKPGNAGVIPSQVNDAGVVKTVKDSWKQSASAWLKVVPQGLRVVLRESATKYGNPPIFITENDVSDDGTLSDDFRISYYREYLKQMLLAIYVDGVNVQGYYAWSLLNNFEWHRANISAL